MTALALLAGSAPAAGTAAGTASRGAVLLPSAVRDPAIRAGLAGALGLDPERLHVLRRDFPPGPLAIRDPRPLLPVALSPRGDLVAYSAWREVSCDPAYSLRIHFAVVADTTGEESAALPGVWDFAWSPEGDRLALVYGHARRGEGFVPDSIGVLDVRARQGTTFPLEAAGLSWRDSMTLVLQSSRVQELSLRTGEIRPVRRRGGLLSPDSRYSLSIGGEDDAPRVADCATGADLTSRVRALFGKAGFDVVSPPFWVGGDPPGHLLCLPIRRSGASPPKESATGDPFPSCSVEIVDVAQCRVVRSFPGLGLAATPDRRAVVLYRSGGLAFEDL